MKQILVTTILLALFSCTNTSNTEYSTLRVDANLKSKFFASTKTMLNPLTIKTKNGYDGLIDSTEYQINSNILVNNDSLRSIRFTKLKRISNDTLRLSIYETNPMYHHNLIASIIGTSFKITYDFDMSGPSIDPNIKTITQELILKSLPNKKGDSVYGYLNYLGKCNFDCDGEIKIKGYFKTKLD
ncbi:hypothetical protein FBALC1_10612 [Flavobacteriales bacterium ALC-1]|nr:hypothetical protein FBALC1_10612 [Flavobacteriales bacterium ALC-1]